MKFIKVFEQFEKSIGINVEYEVETTFRFLLKRGVSPDTLHRKIKEKFVEQLKPPFTYNDILYNDFEIAHIADIPVKNGTESEYTIKAVVSINIGDKKISNRKIDNMIRRGITTFLKLEEDKFFSKEVALSTIISYDQHTPI